MPVSGRWYGFGCDGLPGAARDDVAPNMRLKLASMTKSLGRIEVSASEEAVGATGSSMMDVRRPVESPKELANLQQLFDSGGLARFVEFAS